MQRHSSNLELHETKFHTIEQLLNSHRSIRKFTPRPVSDELVHRLIAAGQAAASSSFLQGVTIIRISDRNKRTSF